MRFSEVTVEIDELAIKDSIKCFFKPKGDVRKVRNLIEQALEAWRGDMTAPDTVLGWEIGWRAVDDIAEEIG